MAPFRTESGAPVAAVTADEMREVDRVAVEEVGLGLLQMMENAGRTLAWHARDAREAGGAGEVVVVAGNGGNGGGGLACARHLTNRGVGVEVVLDRPPGELTGAAAQQYGVLDAMGVPTGVGPDALAGRDPAVVVDALVGYGLGGALREPARSIVEAVNGGPATVVSLDVPSGVDATTGEPLGAAVAPDRTVTLALPKTGLADRPEGLVLADISVPATVYRRLDIEYRNPFGERMWVDLV
ncbi:MAG: NAD(P)H-hydrate epimerase [Halobacteriaceae archaeon]